MTNRPRPGTFVVLKMVPQGLLSGLPDVDQEAIRAIVGQAVLLVEYDDSGRAELEFKDSEGTIHSVWVDPIYISPAAP